MNIISTLRRDGPRHVERSIFGWTAALVALALAASPLAAAQDANTDTLPTRVGRLSNATGTIYLAPPERADDWNTRDEVQPMALEIRQTGRRIVEPQRELD